MQNTMNKRSKTIATLSVFLVIFSVTLAFGDDRKPAEPNAGMNQDAKVGYLIDFPTPLTTDATSSMLAQLGRLADSSNGDTRVTVVVRYASEGNPDLETRFEDALRIARAITQPELRGLRIVSWVEGDVSGHSVLPILASDLLIVSSKGTIGDATRNESTADETIEVSYRTIAAKRGLFPPEVVTALVDPSFELARISKVDGTEVFAFGEELRKVRSSGQVASESIWSSADTPLRLDASQLRSSRIAAGTIDSMDEASRLLDLAAIHSVNQLRGTEEPVGVLMELIGSINPGRARRWQSNLTATLESNQVNTWIVSIDSPGGSLTNSASLAAWFSQPEPPLQTVAGLVQGEARGDASLIAIACQPLLMRPSSKLGGPGADAISRQDIDGNDELIEQIARSTKRPAALIRGLLDPSLEVFRYIDRKTGRIRYATEEDLVRGVEDADAERERYDRGDRIDLADGLTAAQAIALGLADGESPSIDDVSRRVGLSGTPPPLTDRKMIRFVERLGRSNGLAIILLLIGFAALSTEANAPGLGIPGFVAAICFALFFWIKYLAGTAEWLELLAFSLGLIFIAIEIFVVPGFGIFGIGGIALTVLGIVLMSQTFVVPRNVYQVEVLTHSIWAALISGLGMIGGFIAMRMMMPHVPILSGLAMEPVDNAVLSEKEKLVDYAHLIGQTGTTTTPLRPSGKAKFGEEIVQVVSDGSSVSTGEFVRVIEVHGPRVVVEALEN